MTNPEILVMFPVLALIVMYLDAANSSSLDVMNSFDPRLTDGKSSFCVPVPALAVESSIISKSVTVVELPSIIRMTFAVPLV